MAAGLRCCERDVDDVDERDRAPRRDPLVGEVRGVRGEERRPGAGRGERVDRLAEDLRDIVEAALAERRDHAAALDAVDQQPRIRPDRPAPGPRREEASVVVDRRTSVPVPPTTPMTRLISA